MSEENSPLSPRLADMKLSDYYTIAAVLDQSPDDGSDAMTSFSNPNYGLDAINSNFFLPPPPYDPNTTDRSPGDDDAMTVDNSATLSSAVDEPIQSKHRFANLGVNDSERATEFDGRRMRRLLKKTSTGSVPNSDEEEEEEENENEEEEVEKCGREFESIVNGIDSEERSDGRNDEERREVVLRHGKKTEVKETMGKKTILEKNESKEHSLFRDIYSPDSNDSGIQADVTSQTRSSPGDATGQRPVFTKHSASNDKEANETVFTSDIYQSEASSPQPETGSCDDAGNGEDSNGEPSKEVLPRGWQKHEDGDGAYYWHIKSGTIQREPPSIDQYESANQEATTSCQFDGGSDVAKDSLSARDGVEEMTSRENSEVLSSEQPSTRRKDEEARNAENATYPMRFAVRSLGWVQISEEDLTPERSSRSVNKCIVGLSLGKNDLNDVVGRWGDGKSLYMELDEENLVLIDPQDMCLLNIQPIHSIRVWGVGRSNGRERDFAYVARDSITHKHMCHVFRCDGLARHIASALRDICKQILTERTLRHRTQAAAAAGTGVPSGGGNIRPNNLPNLERIRDPPNGQHLTFDSLYKNTSFPTPMEEPKKVLRCHYLGTTQVLRPTGVEILNSAIENVYMRLPPDRWTYVNVAVAPSTITITEHGKPQNVFAECRVRFLSFMGIAMNNIRLCSFIMHCAQDQFVAHIFHCDPSAGALCKTIEAACKLRYQKCLDAQRCRPFSKNHPAQDNRPTKGIGVSIKHGVQTVIGNLTKGCKPKS